MANRILLADSDDRSREMLGKLLAIYGVESIKNAPDGFAALEVLNAEIPTMAILDANLQKIDGIFLSEVLRFVPRFREVKVVLLANDFSGSLMQKGMQLGIHAFIERPINAENVKNLVQLLSSEQEYQDANLPVSINKVITALSSSAKRNLTLLFGRAARILKIEALKDEYAKKNWDFVAQINLQGQVSIQVASGATNESAAALAEVIPMTTSMDRSPAAVLQAFLSGVIEKALPDLQKTFVVQPKERTTATGLVQINRNAQYQFAIHMRVGLESALLRKQFAIPLYVAVTLA